MLGALGIGKKREAVKFNFNLSVTSIEAFDPTKISKVSDDATYCISWKRGKKRNGKTENLPFNAATNKILWMAAFKFNGTLFKDSKAKSFKKKLLSFTFEETANKKTKIVAKAEYDLSRAVNEEQECTESITLDFPIAKGHVAKLKLTLNSKNMKDMKQEEQGNLSSYTGVDTEVEDHDDAAKEEDKEEHISAARDDVEAATSTGGETTGASLSVASESAIKEENKERVDYEIKLKKYKDEIADLQKQVSELKQVKDTSVDSKKKTALLENLQKERDDAKKKTKAMEMEMERVKQELHRLHESSATSDNKVFAIQLETQKVKTNFEKLLQEERQKFETEKAQLLNKMGELETKYKSILTDYDDIQQVVNENQNGFEQMKKEKTELQDRLDKSKKHDQDNMNKVSDENEQLHSQVDQLQQRIGQLTLQHEQFIQTDSSLQQQLSDLKKERDEKDENWKRAEENAKKVKEYVQKAEEQNKLLEQEVKQLKTKMEQQIIESTSEKDTLSASLKALQSEMTAQAIEIKSLKNELSQTNEEKNHLAHELADRNQAFTELKTEYDTIYNLQNSLQRSKTEVERAFSELQQIVEEKKKAIQAMEIKFNQELVEKEGILSEWKKKHSIQEEELQHQLNDLQEKHQQTVKQLASAEQSTIQQKETTKALDTQVQAAAHQQEELYKQFNQKTEQCAILLLQIEDLKINYEQNLEQKEKTITGLQAQCNELQNMQQSLQNQIDKLEGQKTEILDQNQQKINECNTHIHQINLLKENVQAVNEQLKESHHEQVLLQQKLQEKEASREQLAAEMDRLQTIKQSIEVNYYEHKEKVNKLEQELGEREFEYKQDIEKSKVEVNELTTKIETLSEAHIKECTNLQNKFDQLLLAEKKQWQQEMDGLRSELHEKEQSVIRHEKELEEIRASLSNDQKILQQALAESKEQLVLVTNDNQRNVEEIFRLSIILQQKHQALLDTEKQAITEQEKNKKQFHDALKLHEEEIAAITAQKEVLKSRCDKYLQDAEEKASQHNKLEKELSIAAEHNQNLENQLKNTRIEVSQTITLLEEEHSKFANIQSILQQEESTVAQLKQIIQTTEEKVSDSLAQLKLVQQEKQLLENQLATMELSIKESQEFNKKELLQITSQRENLLDQSEQRVASLQAIVEEMTLKEKNTEKELDAIRIALHNTETTASTLQQSNIELDTALKILKQKIDLHNQDLRKKSEEIEIQATTINAMQIANAGLKSQIAQKTEELLILQNDMSSKTSNLQAELLDKQQDSESFKTKENNLTARIQELNDQVLQWQVIVSQTEDRLTQRQTINKQLEVEKENMTIRIEELLEKEKMQDNLIQESYKLNSNLKDEVLTLKSQEVALLQQLEGYLNGEKQLIHEKSELQLELQKLKNDHTITQETFRKELVRFTEQRQFVSAQIEQISNSIIELESLYNDSIAGENMVATISYHQDIDVNVASFIDILRAESGELSEHANKLSKQKEKLHAIYLKSVETRKILQNKDNDFIELSKQTSQLQDAIVTLQTSEQQLKIQLSQERSEKQILEDKISVYESNLNESESAKGSIAVEFAQTKSEKESLSRQLSDLKQQNIQLSSENSLLKENISKLTTDYDMKLKLLETTKNGDLSKLQLQINELKSSKQIIEEQLQSNAIEKSELTNSMNHLEESKQQMCESKDGEIALLRKQIEALEVDVRQLKAENAAFILKIEEYKDQIEQATRELKQNEDQKQVIANSKQESAGLNEHVQKLVQEKDELEKAKDIEIKRLKKSLKLAEKEKEEVTEQKNQEVSQLESKIALMKEELRNIAKLGEEKQRSDQQIAVLSSQLLAASNRDTELRDLQTEAKKLTDEKAVLVSENMTLSASIDSYKEKLDMLQKSIDELQSQKKERTKEFDRLVCITEATKQEELERFVLENAILFVPWPHYTNNIPTYLKILYLSVLNWKCFDVAKNKTFCLNLGIAFEHVMEANKGNIELLGYWIELLYRLLHLLQIDFASEVAACMKEVTSTMEITTFEGKPSNMEFNAPVFVAAQDEQVVNRKGNVKEIAKSFILSVYSSLVKGYFNLLHCIFHNLGPQIDSTMFSKTEMNNDVGVQVQPVLLMLHGFKELLSKNLEPRIINHIFEHVSQYADAYMFNSLIKNASVNTGRAIQIKMSASYLETWFTDNGIKSCNPIDQDSQIIFKYSRQSADACILAQKELLTDENMRSIVCPILSVSQVGYLLSNYMSDEFDKAKVPANVLQTLKQIEGDVSKLYAKPVVNVSTYTNIKTGKPEARMLFDFMDAKLNNMEVLAKLPVPPRFTKRKELKFLFDFK